MSTLALERRNPDVLDCIANLSNDEVFTPPELANQMLDMVADVWAADHDGANLWADPTVRFLDPFTKSGVFPRQITERLVDGLATTIPDLQERVDHILNKQVFGMAITELTALLARRSLYCSRDANGPHSITKRFNDPDGNIWFQPTQHTWVRGRCEFCGASEETLNREGDLETHAYALIHTTNAKKLVEDIFGANMQFDIVIGNPPYQLDDGGAGQSAAPIYQKFVESAKTLDPALLVMITPSRWFAGGKGLDDFRETMLSDTRIRYFKDYLNANDVFSGVGLKGGVSYFLWDRDNPGDCEISTFLAGQIDSTATRKLMEQGLEIFVRFNEGIDILRKVIKSETGQSINLGLPGDKRFSSLVSSRKPFGFATTFKGNKTHQPGDIKVYQNGGIGYIKGSAIEVGRELIDYWKIYIGRAAPGTGNRDTYPHQVLATPFIGEPNSVSTETYLCIGPFLNETAAKNALSYLSCKITRFLVQLHKPSQDTTKKVYNFVPIQDWSHPWTDELLQKKYGITDDEMKFIDKLVKPVDWVAGDNE